MNERVSSAQKYQGGISWQELHKLIHPALASAPQLEWSRIDRRSLRYLLGTVSGTLWLNHLAFLVAVLTSRAQLDAQTIVRLEQVKRQGLGPETVKMQALLRQCDMTLEEMTMMEQYRKDEMYDPPICLEKAGEQPASLAQENP